MEDTAVTCGGFNGFGGFSGFGGFGGFDVEKAGRWTGATPGDQTGETAVTGWEEEDLTAGFGATGGGVFCLAEFCMKLQASAPKLR